MLLNSNSVGTDFKRLSGKCRSEQNTGLWVKQQFLLYNNNFPSITVAHTSVLRMLESVQQLRNDYIADKISCQL